MNARLKRIGDGQSEGTLEGHPCKHMMVRAYRWGDQLIVQLWDGPHMIGDGALKPDDGYWRGICTEFVGQWRVSGKMNTGTLEFTE